MTIAADGTSEGTLSVSVEALGTSDGGSYSIGATPDASVTATESSSNGTETTQSGTNDTTISQANGTTSAAGVNDTTGPERSPKTTEPESVPGFSVGLGAVAVLIAVVVRRRR